MSVPARRITNHIDELSNKLQSLSEFELYAIILDCKRTLPKLTHTHEAALYLSTIGSAYIRLHHHQESLEYFRRAAALEPTNAEHLLNVGAALTNVGKYSEAIDALANISNAEPAIQHLIWVNTSECLFYLGLHVDAYEAFDEAIRTADLTDKNVLLVLARQAAIIGADDESLELLARLVACCTQTPLADRLAIDVVANAPSDLREVIRENESLRTAVERAVAFSGIQRSRIAAPSTNATDDLVDQESLAMFEATRPMRARANQAVIAELDDA